MHKNSAFSTIENELQQNIMNIDEKLSIESKKDTANFENSRKARTFNNI